MTYPFEKIFSDFKYLSLCTELLEECGWDEDEYEKTSNFISSALEDIQVNSNMSDFDYAWKPVRNRLHGKLTERQIQVVKKMITCEWDLIKQHYDQWEN